MNYSRSTMLVLVGLAAAAVTPVNHAHAAPIDLQFNFGSASYTGHQSPGFQQGDFLATDNTWNQLSGIVNSTTPLKADGTAANGVTVQTGHAFDSNAVVWGVNGITSDYIATTTGAPGTVYDSTLMRNLSYDASTVGVGVRVSGLTPGLYNVYVIANNNDEPSAVHNVYAGLNLSNAVSSMNDFLTATPTALGPSLGSETTWINGTNYLMETIAVTSTSDWLTVIDTHVLGGSPPLFTAVQIAQVVPEPGSVVLLALGGLGLLAIGRIRRRD